MQYIETCQRCQQDYIDCRRGRSPRWQTDSPWLAVANKKWPRLVPGSTESLRVRVCSVNIAHSLFSKSNRSRKCTTLKTWGLSDKHLALEGGRVSCLLQGKLCLFVPLGCTLFKSPGQSYRLSWKNSLLQKVSRYIAIYIEYSFYVSWLDVAVDGQFINRVLIPKHPYFMAILRGLSQHCVANCLICSHPKTSLLTQIHHRNVQLETVPNLGTNLNMSDRAIFPQSCHVTIWISGANQSDTWANYLLNHSPFPVKPCNP